MTVGRHRRRSLPRSVGALMVVFGFSAGLVLYWSTWGDTAGVSTDPARVLDDPDLVFDEPWLLADGLENRVYAAVRECMDRRSAAYQKPTISEPVADDDASADYRPLANLESMSPDELDAYETALYGAPLRELDGPVVSSGCAVAGQRALEESLDELAATGFTYDTLAELQSAQDAGSILEDLAACVQDADLGGILSRGTLPDCEDLAAEGGDLQHVYGERFVTANRERLQDLLSDA